VRGAVVLLLAERPMHGYEVIHEITERSNGAWKPSPGAIYPTLKALEEHEIVTSEEADGKRTFSLTAEGRALAEELSRARPAPWAAARESMSEERQALRSGVEQLADAARQVAGTGTAAQQQRAAEILAQARRELYKLLAEDA
jgi:DNA-binding PadR family transcriptional regulator